MSKQTPDLAAAPDLAASLQQLTKLGESLVEAGKTAGNIYVDGYESLVEVITNLQEKLAAQAADDNVKTAVANQVDVTRKVAAAYTSAARKLLS